MSGVVYLVGAGPGDPELITVRGLACLRRADVVVYDRLIDRRLLDEIPPAARRVYAGKRPGRQALRQEEIDALLVRHARAGRTVVRLKGGDPFVFGRGGEEALACAAAGVAWEVVPGVSSAIAVPARAAVPLTHRGLAASFAVVTGHSPGDPRLDWEALARIDTLVVLMGAAHLAEIALLLQRHGRPAATPAAVVENGTLPDERVIIGTLADVVGSAAAAGIGSPATLVVGEVVNLRERLLGQEEQPSSAASRMRSTTCPSERPAAAAAAISPASAARQGLALTSRMRGSPAPSSRRSTRP
ncbi:MAG TPA: uroporphyrinogen-III C-methyltransferase [Thermoanaerobaculia bacterium]|nr:uroporphyrinogen-III C-methyltransferase [Thermoanaerobaculia bacterium]